MKKRILPALLALCMVMSLLPVAFAADCSGDTAGDASCTASTHTGNCPKKCQAAAGCTNSKATGLNYCDDHKCTVSGCTKEKGHADAHTNTTCDGSIKATTGATCGATNHVAGCGLFAQCTFGGEGGKCTKENGHTGAHNNTKCAGQTTAGHDCGAAAGTHVSGCASYTACGAGAVQNAQGQNVGGCTKCQGHSGKHEGTKCTKEQSNTNQCPASVHDATCGDKCTKTGCTLTVNHTQKHNTTETCSQDALCAASTHNANCPKCCGNTANVNAGTGATGCTKTVGHTDKHSGTSCTKDSRCPATTHTAPVYTDEEMTTVKAGSEGCPKFVACTVCTPTANNGEYTPKAASHTDPHNNTEKCLGYANDKRCGADGHHIAGCPNYCSCGNSHAGCTHQPGCPACAELGDCDCPVCKANPNPGMGVVTDENGEAVDPADPTTPEIPTKAEDFKDADKMDDWMKDAAQVMLDKGWMQGTTEGNFDPREEAATNMVLTVIARMDGETITGATWADDAKAWAEKNELTEGIEITKSDIARKDIVLMLWRLAGKPGSEQALDDFTDVDELKDDHLTAMKWAVEKKIVLGNGDGTVTPDGTLKRAELAAMVARYAALEK